MNRTGIALAAMVAGVAAFGLASQASAAMTMKATYFEVSETNDPDFNHNGCCSGMFVNEVLGTLGPDGLPVYNASYGGPTLNDVNGAGELTWWSPSQNPNVVQTGVSTITLPFANSNMFPPNSTGSSDANGFETAVFTGVLTVPTAETVTFDVASDDDSFLAINGPGFNNQVIRQVGGIHPVWNPGSFTETLGPGTYDLSLFYVDRLQVAAARDFSVSGAGVTLNAAVPEPSTWAMMILGVGAIGFALRRQRKTAAVPA